MLPNKGLEVVKEGYEVRYWNTLIQLQNKEHRRKLKILADSSECPTSKLLGKFIADYISKYERKHGIIR